MQSTKVQNHCGISYQNAPVIDGSPALCLKNVVSLAAVCFSSLIGSAYAQDTIVDIATDSAAGSNLVDLTSLTLNRGGSEVTIPVSDLIGINVLGYDNAIETIPFEGAILGTPDLPAGPAVGSRASLLDGDVAINTGVNNPSEDEGLLFSFQSAITNGPGADLVIFEFGAAPGSPIPSDPSGNTLAPAGDPFAVAGVLPGVGSLVDAARTASFDSSDYSFFSENGFASDIFFFNPAAGEDFSDIDVLENGGLEIITPPGATAPASFDLNLFGALVDLSDLGFEDGESVSSLRLLAVGPTFAIDPSFIAGLPAVPEPSSASLILASACGILVRRRRSSRSPQA